MGEATVVVSAVVRVTAAAATAAAATVAVATEAEGTVDGLAAVKEAAQPGGMGPEEVKRVADKVATAGAQVAQA